jgi:hypothetical protein
MPVQHLLKQVEIYKSRKTQRDNRPEWVTEFIEQVAELFEPLSDDGRVGFDCQLLNDEWVIGLYLGSTELVGGPRDGQIRLNNFQFDLHSLIGSFCNIDSLIWDAIPAPAEEANSDQRSSITVTGRVGENNLQLQIFSTPPSNASPGFRELADGTRQPS